MPPLVKFTSVIGMFNSQTSCSTFSSEFTTATCSTNEYDEVYVDFTMDSEGEQDLSFTITNFRNALSTGAAGPVYITIFKLVDGEYFSVSGVDTDSDAEQLFVAEIATPYTIDGVVSVLDGTVDA